MSASPDPKQQLHANIVLQRRYEEADDVERQAMGKTYLAAWRALSVPQTYEPSSIEEEEYRSFFRHLDLFFPDEADALPILEERCVASGLHNGLYRMFDTLSDGSFELGPLTAARAEAVYAAKLAPGKGRDMDGHSYLLLRGNVLSVLGQCGESGMAVLQRLDVLDTPEGFSALNSMGIVESEPLFWELLEDPDTGPEYKLKIIRAIQIKTYNYPDPDRERRYREPLVALLQAPTTNESYQLGRLEQALELVTRTQDKYYYPHVVALESTLDWNLMAEAERIGQGGMDPDMFPLQHTVASLREAIKATKATLR